MSQTLSELMTKLDETEADIARMSSEIEKVQEVIDNVEEGKKEEKGKARKEKALSVNDEFVEAKKEEKEIEGEDEDGKTEKKKVNVKVTNFSPAKISGLEVISCLFLVNGKLLLLILYKQNNFVFIDFANILKQFFCMTQVPCYVYLYLPF